MKEDYRNLTSLSLADLYNRFAYDEGNPCDDFNNEAEEYKSQLLIGYKKKELLLAYEKVGEYLEIFSEFKKAFFGKYVQERNEQAKIRIEDYLRSCELYFVRASTLSDKLVNALTKIESRTAILWAKTGITVAVILFAITYLYPPPIPKDHSYNVNFRKDSVEFAKIESKYNLLLKKEDSLLIIFRKSKSKYGRPSNH